VTFPPGVEPCLNQRPPVARTNLQNLILLRK